MPATLALHPPSWAATQARKAKAYSLQTFVSVDWSVVFDDPTSPNPPPSKLFLRIDPQIISGKHAKLSIMYAFELQETIAIQCCPA